MKYLIIPAFLTLIAMVNLQAQEESKMELKEHKISLSSGKLNLQEINGVTIEGTSGNEVIIQAETRKSPEDDRAAGLKEISALGLSDNTGLGLNVKKEGNVATVQPISKNNSKRYTIKVPPGVAVNYEHSSYMAKELNIRNTSSEIEVSSNYNKIKIENASSPLAINSVYGGIEATFDRLSPNNDITLYSVYSFVDVTVPANAKATFHLSTSFGQMFTDLDLSFESEKEEGMRNLSNKDMVGKFNGGGTNVKLTATYGKLYLRKK